MNGIAQVLTEKYLRVVNWIKAASVEVSGAISGASLHLNNVLTQGSDSSTPKLLMRTLNTGWLADTATYADIEVGDANAGAFLVLVTETCANSNFRKGWVGLLVQGNTYGGGAYPPNAQLVMLARAKTEPTANDLSVAVVWQTQSSVTLRVSGLNPVGGYRGSNVSLSYTQLWA